MATDDATPTETPPLTAQATWNGEWRVRRFATQINDHQVITLANVHLPSDDSTGTPDPTPMEALLVALAGCLGMSALPMLRRARVALTGYTVHVEGSRAPEPPRPFTAITAEHIVTGHALDRAQVERAINLGEAAYCSVSATLRPSVNIIHHVTLRDTETDEPQDDRAGAAEREP